MPDEAGPQFRRAFTLDPRFGDALASWAELLSRRALQQSTPQLLDSISRAARRALAVSPENTRALVATGRVAMLRNHPDEALTAVGRALEGNASDVEALQLRCELLLLTGDSAGVWRDVERIVRIAPRSPNALVDAANDALALRRFSDAREYMRRARALQPRRVDLVLAAAQLARVTGNEAEMIRLVHEARTMGATLGTSDLALLRSGDSDMQQELATATPGTFHAVSAADSFHFYMSKAKLFIGRRDSIRAEQLVDAANTALKSVLADANTTALERRAYVERRDWIDAASGDHARQVAAMINASQTMNVQRYPNGSFEAFVACNDAEIYALGADVERMIPRLEKCLTLPGGYSVSALRGEPALARHARDPRVGVMLSRLGLDLDRQ